MRAAALLSLLVAALCRPQGDVYEGTESTAGVAENAFEAWQRWLGEETAADSFLRTRAELKAFDTACGFQSDALHAVHGLHGSLAKTLVLDVRHPWPGLSGQLESFTLGLRAGRALRRATFVFADGCAAPRVPPRPPRVPGAHCAFDASDHVQLFGGVSWRWSSLQAARVNTATGGAPELLLRYACNATSPDGTGCGAASLMHANGSEAVHSAGPGAEAVADVLWRYVRDDLGAVPVIRLELSSPGDLAGVGVLPWVCEAAGHPAGVPCSLGCDAFANWRPKPRLWVSMKHTLTKMDAFPGGLVAVHARTGGAELFPATSDAMVMVPVNSQEASQTPANLSHLLAGLFEPCDAREGGRNPFAPPHHPRTHHAVPGEPACVSWASPLGGAGSYPVPGDVGSCGIESPVASSLEATFPGPLGGFFGCAARAAASLAAEASAASAAMAARPPSASGGVSPASPEEAALAVVIAASQLIKPEEWGIMVVSDSPGLHCATESGPASPAHAAATPAAPGHTSLAPDAMLQRLALSALKDFYYVGLADAVLSVTTSGFVPSAQQRRMLPTRTPQGSALSSFGPGHERFFASGRDAWPGGMGVDFSTLRVLGRTLFTCYETRDAVAVAATAYGVGLQPKQDRTLRPPPAPSEFFPGRSSNLPGHANISIIGG